MILSIGTTVLNMESDGKVNNKRTDWNSFRELVHEKLHLKVALKTETDIDSAVRKLTLALQECCWMSTPEDTDRPPQSKTYSDSIRQKILEKRRLRRVWHTSRHSNDKKELNKAIRELKILIKEANNNALNTYLEGVTATKQTNYSLWKTCKNFNRPLQQKPPLRKHDSQWIRNTQDKAEAFSERLSQVFKPNEAAPEMDEASIDSTLNQDLQLDIPLKPVTPKEVWRNIKTLKKNKAPGYDMIDTKVLEESPRKVIVYLTMLFNAVMRVGYFPDLWKVSNVIMLQKPGKPIHEITSYRPISLLMLS